MIAIIVDEHAHRLLNSGVVESAEVTETEPRIISGSWNIVNPPIDLGIENDDFYAIKKQLEFLHAMFPEGRKPIPTFNKPEETQVNPNDPRK